MMYNHTKSEKIPSHEARVVISDYSLEAYKKNQILKSISNHSFFFLFPFDFLTLSCYVKEHKQKQLMFITYGAVCWNLNSII